MINGAILYGAELLRRRAATPSLRARVVTAAGGTTVFASATAAVPTTGRTPTWPSGAGIAVDEVDDGTVDPTLAAGESGEGDIASDARITERKWWETTLIGSAQILALLPGISRSGATMAAGLTRGLSHEDAARFSFLLATPVILAAGVLKLPDLFGPLGRGIGGQVIVGSIASGVGAYVTVRFLTRYFQTRTLTPFALYCAVAGAASLIWLTVAR
jgi:hypothetical protein